MQTVGEFLRAERLKKGLSIKDVESSISIRALYLNAIEEGNYGIIPGEVYLKGFIRNYATFLGLDPQAVMEIYREGKGQTTETVPLPEKTDTKPAKPSPSQSGGSLLKWVSVAIILGGIVAGLTWWTAGSQKSEPTPPQSTAQQQTVETKQPPTAPNVPPAPSQSATQPKSTEPATKIVVTAKYNSQCWTQITADGKEIYEGIPKSGDSLTWEAANKLTAKFGNAGAVDLVYNGSAVGKIGGNGDVVMRTFTLTGITQ